MTVRHYLWGTCGEGARSTNHGLRFGSSRCQSSVPCHLRDAADHVISKTGILFSSLLISLPHSLPLRLNLGHRTTSRHSLLILQLLLLSMVLGKYQRASPPTSTDPVTHQTTSLSLDLEKSHVRGDEIESTAHYHERHVLPVSERKVIRKMDFRVVPLVTALYILSFLDRSNIGKYVKVYILFCSKSAVLKHV